MASNNGSNVGEWLTGTSLNDLIYGGNGKDTLFGGDGADRLYGENGDDSLHGERGNDRLFGGNGDDYLAGGEGNDRLRGERGNDVLDGGAGNDRLNGGEGDDRMAGGAGNDTYFVDSLGDVVIEFAGEGTDTVRSTVDWTLGENVETLMLIGSSDSNGTGNGLANQIVGNAGANVLLGEGGNDELKGGAGNDWIEGGAGRDRMFGGAGADTFAFRDGDFAGWTKKTADRIQDFNSAQGDRIDLSLVDADIFTDGDQEFQFIGTGTFNKVPGELRSEVVGGATYVYADTDGDGSADFMIYLDGSHALTDGDFIL